MLKIRLQRAGRKNLPQYRIVLAEHSAPVKGKFIEKLGNYDPRAKTVSLKKEAILSWLDKGAKPSNTAAKILLANDLKHKNVVYQQRKARLAKKQDKPKQEPKPENNEIKETEAPAVEQEQPKQEIKEEGEQNG